MHTELIRYSGGGAELEGFLAADDAREGRRPAVIIAHAWRGRDDFADGKARTLADLGYVGFAADVYGRGRRGETDEQAGALMQPLVDDRALLRARIGAAVQAISKHKLVDPQRLGAIGFCFGGLTVLELARSAAAVRGVVSFHGLLRTPQPARSGTVRSKVLALHGYDDPLAPPQDVAAFANEMTAAKVDWQMVMYGNNVHAFTNPAANDPARGMRYDVTTDRRSWQAMRAFFEEAFA